MSTNSIINRGSLHSWLLVMSFYLFQYLLRVMPISMRDSWQAEFNMTATDLGLIGASLLYTYSFMQIPIGYSLDRFGIWWVTFISLTLCVLGTFVSAQADSIELLIVSRLLIGMGSACPYICTMKIIYNQFPKSRQNLYTGLTFSLAMVGVVLFNFILQSIVDAYNWKMACYFLFSIGSVIMILFYYFKDLTSSCSNYRSKYSASKIIEIIKTKEVWAYIVITICLYIPLPVFVDIWSGAILAQKYQMISSVTSSISIFGYIGSIIGGVLLTTIANEKNTMTISLIAATSFILSSVYFELSIYYLYAIFFMIGFCTGSVVISFRSIAKYVDPNSLGLAFGVTNTCSMFGLGAINYIIGKVVDSVWNGDLTEAGEKLYTSMNYQYAITAVLLPIMLLGLVLSLMNWDNYSLDNA